MKKNSLKSNAAGFTLIEGIVGIAIFSLIAVGVYATFTQATRLVETSRMLVASAALANEEFEIAHNLPYADVGLVHGIPAGKLQHVQNISRDNFNFLVTTTIRSIDDPFDGTLGGSPNDTSPADYKLMQVDISLPGVSTFPTQSYTEYIAPKNLENSTANGALFVRVFDANGKPVTEAKVHVENDLAAPAIIVDDVTNKDGILEIVDVPPGVNAYRILVSKNGYSQDRTYPTGSSTNPNPITPDATIVTQQVTQTSFVIDQTSALNVESVTQTCVPVANVAYALQGSKLIGSSPDILKYQHSFSTGALGATTISGLEWDTYNLSLTDATRDLAGAISPIPFSLAPGSVQDVKIVAAPKDPNSILVSVQQGGTVLPLSGATVELSHGTSTIQMITGRGFLRQSDWSGGSGQENFIDPTSYLSSDGNIETAGPAGEIKLKQAFGLYAVAGNIISSTFDTGSASNFYQLEYLPADQPAAAGTSSVRIQIATNNDDATWDFTGPDGSASTFYTATGTNIYSGNNGNRYFRYKIFLTTASSTFTPDVGEINFTFSSLCVPSGQVMFTGLADADYTLDVSKAGFESSHETITVSSPWQQHQVTLLPQ